MTNLKNCRFGRLYYVKRIDNRLPEKDIRRLCDLGIVPNTRVKSVRKSLLGKAILIELRGYTLSLRSSLAECVLVEE